jgi:uncharacterized protein YdaU (DUF1376 family)
MAKNPIMPLYYNDIDRSTKDWTDEEFGAYMRLLMEQWDKGYIPTPYQKSTESVPNDIPLNFQRLSRISTSVRENWSLLSKKFVPSEHGLQNVKLEEIRQKQARHKENQKNNIEKRYQKSTKLSTKNIPLENESDNENEIEYDKENDIRVDFEVFWNLYDKKVGNLDKLKKEWNGLTYKEQIVAIDNIPKYKKSKSDKRYIKDPLTYLTDKTFNDEIIPLNGKKIESMEGISVI